MPVAPQKPARRGRRKSGSVLAAQSRQARSGKPRRGTNRRRVPLREQLPSIRQIGTQLLAFGRRSLPAVGIASGVALAIGGSYYAYEWFTHSPRFAISELQVKGHEHLSEEEIAALLSLPENANIFRTDMGSLETALERSPWIVSADVSRDLPRGLEIVIREESAVAAVDLGGLYLANAEGALFKRASTQSTEIDGLTIITGLTREAHLADPEGSQTQLHDAIEALAAYSANDERPRIGGLHLDERHGMSLITFENAIAIHIGTPAMGEFAERYRAFDSAWHALDAEEHAAARSFRIADRTPSDRVTVAFAGN